MSLSDLQIKKFMPHDIRYEVSDGKGLSIRITPHGTKTWIFRYRYNGISRRMTLGNYPGIALADARQRHAEAMQDLQRGMDPGLKAREEKAKLKAAPSFKDLFQEFWELELKAQPSARERRRLVEKDVLKPWGNRKVVSITRRDAVLLLDGVRERAPVTANRLQGVLVRMFNFASERGIVEHSPLIGMKRGKEQARARVLTDEEIVLLWKALNLECKEIDIYRPSKLALKLILLTGQRPGEITNMRWDQIDGDWWTIPSKATKTREQNRVPLLDMSKEILQIAQQYSDMNNFPHVFASSYNQGKPLTVRALANAIRRHSVEIGITDHFTPHDLRRTLRTRLAELGVSDVIAEKVLGHKLQGIAAVYNRYSYDNEKREALLAWQNQLCKILKIKPHRNEKIVSLAGVRYAR